jgi:hypothetical protein
MWRSCGVFSHMGYTTSNIRTYRWAAGRQILDIHLYGPQPTRPVLSLSFCFSLSLSRSPSRVSAKHGLADPGLSSMLTVRSPEASSRQRLSSWAGAEPAKAFLHNGLTGHWLAVNGSPGLRLFCLTRGGSVPGPRGLSRGVAAVITIVAT